MTAGILPELFWAAQNLHSKDRATTLMTTDHFKSSALYLAFLDDISHLDRRHPIHRALCFAKLNQEHRATPRSPPQNLRTTRQRLLFHRGHADSLLRKDSGAFGHLDRDTWEPAEGPRRVVSVHELQYSPMSERCSAAFASRDA